MNVKQLKEECKKLGIHGYSKLRKKELIEIISEWKEKTKLLEELEILKGDFVLKREELERNQDYIIFYTGYNETIEEIKKAINLCKKLKTTQGFYWVENEEKKYSYSRLQTKDLYKRGAYDTHYYKKSILEINHKTFIWEYWDNQIKIPFTDDHKRKLKNCKIGIHDLKNFKRIYNTEDFKKFKNETLKTKTCREILGEWSIEKKDSLFNILSEYGFKITDDNLLYWDNCNYKTIECIVLDIENLHVRYKNLY